MSIALFTPYGTRSEESGIIYLLANYVKSNVDRLWQVRCNGTFPVCDRDRDGGWRRDVSSCAVCMSEQARLAVWSGAEIVNLSTFLTTDEVESTRHWIATLDSADIQQASYAGIEAFALCADSVEARFGRGRLEDLAAIKRYLLTSARAVLAARRMMSELAPDYLFVAGGSDCLSSALLSVARGSGSEIVLFRWRPSERTIHIRRGNSNEVLDCPMLLENVSEMRSNSASWPVEVRQVMDGVLDYLGLSESQLVLPLAQ